jgi:hypothetical protein
VAAGDDEECDGDTSDGTSDAEDSDGHSRKNVLNGGGIL